MVLSQSIGPSLTLSKPLDSYQEVSDLVVSYLKTLSKTLQPNASSFSRTSQLHVSMQGLVKHSLDSQEQGKMTR